MLPDPAAPGRPLRPVPVTPRPDLVTLLPDLRAAISGAGPALLPHLADGRPATTIDSVPDGPDPIALAVPTSGSTGTPKLVALPAAALLASAAATHDRLGGPGHWLLALPAQHVAGLQVLVRSLVAGRDPVALDLTGGFDPDAFAAAAARVRGPRRYVSLVPTQVIRLVAAGGAALDALAGFDAVLLGGAATPPDLRQRAEAAGVRLVPTYGMTETCGGCVYDGRPLDAVDVRIADDGRIELAGPVLAAGYLGDDAATADAFRTGPDGVRRFVTADLGGWDGGRLRVLGRADDVIVTGGLKVAPADVEAALLGMPGVAEAVVVGVPDAEWGQRVAAAVVLAPGAAAPSLPDVRARVATALAPHAAPRQFTVLPELPVRGPGKPDRAAIARALQTQEAG